MEWMFRGKYVRRTRHTFRLGTLWAALFLSACLLISGCGEAAGGAEAASGPSLLGSATAEASSSKNSSSADSSSSDSRSPASSADSKGSSLGKTARTGSYTPPEMVFSEYHPDAAEGTDVARIDLSEIQNGIVSACAHSEKRLKFQVMCGEETYNYNLPGDGTPALFPLTCGNGEYRFRIMENVVDSKYAELYGTSATVTLTSEYAPFLRPSIYISYTADSDCVKKAAELCASSSSVSDEVYAIYDYICETVTYDRAKAATVKSGYVPDPDETMQTGLGICFDYAALAASMLRSRGIPTKMIFGYVSPDDLYHAWNMFYTDETGWVTVSFEVTPGAWSRLDLTFSANGSDSSFIGDGSNYADVYYY